MGTNIDKFVEPSELGSSVGVPIGASVSWLSPSLGAPEPAPPTGFEYADGLPVTTPGSPIFGLTKPEYMKTVANPGAQQRFPRGGSTAAVYGGATPLVTGGNDQHAHTGAALGVSNHNHSMQNHTHNMGSHTHTITPDGSHTHTAGLGGGQLFTSPGVFTNSAGSHQHGGNTGIPNTASTQGPNTSNTGDSGAHGHTLSINNGITTPFFVETAWIIRVI